MKSSLQRIWRTALIDWSQAIRSRRAIVVILVFALLAGGFLFATLRVFGALESQLVESLGLPPAATPGMVTRTLWNSPTFISIMSKMATNSLVFADIRGQHPLVLVQAYFLFLMASFLTLMTSASRLASEIRSGAARFQLVRTSRTEWVLGKFVGEALLLGVAYLVGSCVAEGVLLSRLPLSDAWALFPDILNWSLRAWVYSWAWLGLLMGLSLVVGTGGRATAFCVLVLLATAFWPTALSNLVEGAGFPEAVRSLEILVPQSAFPLLWRESPSALVRAVIQLLAVGLFGLALGTAVFRRRDI